jgi:tetratricopeptide (TPR) repeat protein
MNAVKIRSALDLTAAVLFAGSYCLTAVAQQVDPAGYQRVVDENIELRQEQSRLIKESGELRRKNADLILDVQDLEAKREQLAVLVAQLKTPEESKAELDRLMSERTLLIGELEKARQSLATLSASTNPPALSSPPAPPPVQPSPAQGSSLFRKIEQENADLRQQLTEERAALQSKTKAYEASAALVSTHKAQVEKLSRELGAAKQDFEGARKREASALKALEKMARQSFQQQEELVRLKADVAKLEQEKAEARLRLSRGGAAPTDDVKPGEVVPEGAADMEGALRGAQKAIQGGRLREAEELYMEALKKAPGDARLYYNLGVLYGDYLQNPGKALDYFRKYLELAPLAGDASQVQAWVLELEVQSGR